MDKIECQWDGEATQIQDEVWQAGLVKKRLTTVGRRGLDLKGLQLGNAERIERALIEQQSENHELLAG